MSQVSPVNLTLSLLPSPAFHPHLKIDIHPAPPRSGQRDSDSSARSTNSSSSSCVLQLSFTFPDAIFLDRHELPDSLYSTTTRQVQWDLRPEIIDIERAVLSTRQESAKRTLSELDLGKHSDEGGSTLSLIVTGTEWSSPGSKGSTGERDAENLDPSVWYTVDLPLHARYLKPDASGYQTIEVPEDLRGGWVCSQDPLDHPTDSHFSSDLPPIPFDRLTITLPTGIPSHQALIELGTPLVIWLGCFYLMWKMFNLSSRMRGVKGSRGNQSESVPKPKAT